MIGSIAGSLGRFGPCLIETSHQNNMFSIGYGQNLTDRPAVHYNQMSDVLAADFDNGVWRVAGWEPDPQNPGGRRWSQVPQELHDLAVKAILDNAILRDKLEKWRKDAVKRLEKSVPRLKSEYEAAEARLEALKAISF